MSFRNGTKPKYSLASIPHFTDIEMTFPDILKA